MWRVLCSTLTFKTVKETYLIKRRASQVVASSALPQKSEVARWPPPMSGGVCGELLVWIELAE
jgi:hypothetical protein